ncbi:NACHT domain-containing protein [Streptomyces armeniacus]|uniref:NACHT domain-containing protein n=1 Tax=Streptomyces armeniacus TaxID=83291 RepID=A0A345XX85_9ACTN|nr:NACHT domain-containing protein [Streptomyces armeniacus]AXK36251.1 NACHT domain-containing protein [Streptomyces armeniacus]
MEPVRLPSVDAAPLVRRLFTQQSPVTQQSPAVPPQPQHPQQHPQQPAQHEQLIAGLVSFRGTNPDCGYDELERLAAEFVRLGLGAYELPQGETAGVGTVLARTLAIMGELDTTDVQALRMGPQDYARRLRAGVPGADRSLSPEAASFHDSLLVAVCLHVLNLLIDRSPHLAERLPERSHHIRQLVDLGDVAVVRRRPTPSAEDAAFEERYLRTVVEQCNRVTIHGIDLPNPNTPDTWPLETTYLSLGAQFDDSADDAEPTEPILPLMPAERALATQERLLVRGVAGSGKTTLLQWLAITTARGRLPAELEPLRGRIPFLLPVRRFARSGFPTPNDFLTAIHHPLADEAPDGWIARTLADERALLLVDGLDEAPEHQRAALSEQLRRVLRIYSGNICLVTTRPPAVDATWLTGEGFTELTLAPMNRDQVAAFITAWHTAARTDDGRDHQHLEDYKERLLQSIPLYRELRGLATNPLMCGLICALNRDRSGSLPQGRRELYEAAMEMLLQRRDPERRVLHADDVKLDRAPRERILRKLAYRMLVEERSVLETEAALEEIEAHTPAIPAVSGQGAPDQIFEHLLLRTGLLREGADGTVEFIHRTVQDYLAAKEAVERGTFQLLLEHAHEPEWEEVIRMAVAHARPHECATLLEGLIAPGLTGMPRNRRRLLAAACLEHVTELDPATHARIRRETRHMVRPTTIAAARGLGWVGPIVLEMLPDPATVTDEEAHRLAVTVTRIKDDAAIHYLAQLRHRTSLPLRAELARGWHNFDTAHYAEEIIRHLDSEGLYFPLTDRVELNTLAKLGGRECVQIAGQFTPEELLAGLSRERLAHLWLAYDLGGSMEWLEEFPHLTTLRVTPRLPRVNGVPEGIRIIS